MKVSYAWDGPELVFRSDDENVPDWRANPKDYASGKAVKDAYREWAGKPVEFVR